MTRAEAREETHRLMRLARRLSESRSAITVVALVTVMVVVALVGGLIAAASRIDEMARRHGEQLVANGLVLKESALRACVSPNTVWDDAVRYLDNRYDPDWAATNVGQYFTTTCGVSQVHVLSGDGQMLGSWRAGRAAALVIPAELRAPAAELVAQVRRGEALRGAFPERPAQAEMIARPIDRTAMAATPDGPVVLSVSLVQPDFGSALPSGTRSPVVITVQPVNQAYLDWLGAHFMLRSLHLEIPPFPDHGRREASVMLRDGGGVVIGRVDWDYGRPAAALAWVVGPSVALVLLVTLGAAAAVILRERRQMRVIAEAMTAARAASEAKSRFIANMSHEIRTPMNGVMGVLHLLRGKHLDPDSAQLIEQAVASGALLQGLLNDVLDLSRIEEGRLELDPAPVSPEEILREVSGLFAAQADEKGIDLDVRIQGEPGWVLADGMRLRQVLLNLVGNAIKFTSHGRVEVRLRAANDPDSGALSLRFEVEDTGIGIPAGVKDMLFRRFSQADGSTARRFGGSGLGLSISEALVSLMEGEIGFDSREGEGSTFWFEIRVPPTSAPVVPAASTAASDGDGPLDGLTILLVEDNPTNRMVAARLLEAVGARVETATNGVEGLEAAKTGTYDLILMDVQMPVMDGLTATRRIRALGGEKGRAPIIGLTANVLPEQRATYREAGMDDVASKPIDPAALLQQIGAVLQPA